MTEEFLKLALEGGVLTFVTVVMLYLHVTVLSKMSDNQTQMLKILSLIEDNVKDMQHEKNSNRVQNSNDIY